jgi:hypothetical protein
VGHPNLATKKHKRFSHKKAQKVQPQKGTKGTKWFLSGSESVFGKSRKWFAKSFCAFCAFLRLNLFVALSFYLTESAVCREISARNRLFKPTK